MTVSYEDHKRLCDALYAVDGIRSRLDRDLHVAALNRLLGSDLRFPRHQTDYFDLWQLVDACVKRARGLPSLVVVLRNLDGDTFAVTRFATLVEILVAEPVLDDAEREQLGGLLEPVRPELLRAAYREVVEVVRHESGTADDDLVAMLDRLEEMMPGPDGVPPVVRFAARVAGRPGVPTASRLAGWALTVALRHGVPPSTANALVAAIGVAEPVREAAPAYLVMQITEDGADANRYLVSFWLHVGTTISTTVQTDDDSFALQQLPGRLDSALERLPELSDVDMTRLTIELVLPRKLINEAVDQWVVGQAVRHRVGILYPVVVRSLDRLARPLVHDRWRRKWRWLQAYAHRPDPRAVRLLPVRGAISSEALLSELIMDDPPVCVVCAFPPDTEPQPGRDELGASLYAGIPAIIWCRAESEAARFGADMTAQLRVRGVAELPQLVHRLRQKAARGTADDQVGQHVTLLWDDADRLPHPYVRFRSPTRRETA